MKSINDLSSEQQKNQIYRFRYDVYCDEMKLPLKDEQGKLVDEFDRYSTSFLLAKSSEEIGTIRVTMAKDGPLEIAAQCLQWNERVADILKHDTDRVCEFTRLMVRHDQRGGEAVAQLIDAGLQHCVSNQIDVILLAGKKGVFSRFYGMFGAEVIDTTPFEYVIDGHVLGEYYLMKVDLRYARARMVATIWKMSNRELVKRLGL